MIMQTLAISSGSKDHAFVTTMQVGPYCKKYLCARKARVADRQQAGLFQA